jgi:hypothetical protein
LLYGEAQAGSLGKDTWARLQAAQELVRRGLAEELRLAGESEPEVEAEVAAVRGVLVDADGEDIFPREEKRRVEWFLQELPFGLITHGSGGAGGVADGAGGHVGAFDQGAIEVNHGAIVAGEFQQEGVGLRVFLAVPGEFSAEIGGRVFIGSVGAEEDGGGFAVAAVTEAPAPRFPKGLIIIGMIIGRGLGVAVDAIVGVLPDGAPWDQLLRLTGRGGEGEGQAEGEGEPPDAVSQPEREKMVLTHVLRGWSRAGRPSEPSPHAVIH